MEIAGIKIDTDTNPIATQHGRYGTYYKVASKGDEGALFLQVVLGQGFIPNPKNPATQLPCVGYWVRMRGYPVKERNPWAGFTAMFKQGNHWWKIKQFIPLLPTGCASDKLVDKAKEATPDFLKELKKCVKNSGGTMDFRSNKLTPIIEQCLESVPMPSRAKVYPGVSFQKQEDPAAVDPETGEPSQS